MKTEFIKNRRIRAEFAVQYGNVFVYYLDAPFPSGNEPACHQYSNNYTYITDKGESTYSAFREQEPSEGGFQIYAYSSLIPSDDEDYILMCDKEPSAYTFPDGNVYVTGDAVSGIRQAKIKDKRGLEIIDQVFVSNVLSEDFRLDPFN